QSGPKSKLPQISPVFYLFLASLTIWQHVKWLNGKTEFLLVKLPRFGSLLIVRQFFWALNDP
ncbi:MAG TPA: hypothetical protein VN761_13455, partial [Candidatus Polarisedimenticolia bacterium]|nr:hypothetical protein [Candidatus Polarisedimenticolia bacterium]